MNACRVLHRLIPLAGLALLLVAGAPPARAARSVYGRIADADLVVKVRVIDGTLRLAECKVLQVLRGEYDRPRVFIAFRSDNLVRERWRDRIVFEDGQESILLLEPAVEADGSRKAPDRFRLVGAHLGKIDLPKEGAEAFVQAVARLAEILDMPDIHQRWAAHRALIQETNPFLLEAGFEQILKFRLGEPGMVPVLLDHLDSRHDRFRAASLEVLGQLFAKQQRRGLPLGDEDHVVARILTAALEDPSPSVRVEAVRALHAYGKRDIVAALEQVAQADPSQDVRYEASVSVYQMNRELDNGADGAAPTPR